MISFKKPIEATKILIVMFIVTHKHYLVHKDIDVNLLVFIDQ